MYDIGHSVSIRTTRSGMQQPMVQIHASLSVCTIDQGRQNYGLDGGVNDGSLSVCTVHHGRQNGRLDRHTEKEEDPKEETIDGLRHSQPFRLYPRIVHLTDSMRRMPLERVAIIERFHLDLVHTIPVVPGLDVRQRSL